MMIEKIKSIKKVYFYILRHFISRSQLGACGENTILESPLHIESPKNVFCERNTRIRNDVHIINSPNEKVVIKEYSVIASNVTIITNSHRSTVGIPHFLLGGSHINDKSADVIICEDVWVGANATILAGVTLGRGCIVSAGALVTKSVPPYALVAGVPARIIKTKFSIEQILEHEKIIYKPEKRMKRDNIEKIFSDNFDGMPVFGTDEGVNENAKKILEKTKHDFAFIDWDKD